MSLGQLIKKHQDHIGQSVVLAMLFAMPGLICVRNPQISDNDIWWHLRVGEWIQKYHSVPQMDPFSIYGIGKEWLASSWLFEWTALQFYYKWSLVGIIALSIVVLGAIAASLYHALRRLQSDFMIAVLLAVISLWGMSRIFSPRPWLFSILFFILQLNILLNSRKTGETRYLIWIPFIYVLWANLHIQFVYGLAALGIAVAEPTIERCWPHKATKIKSRTLLILFFTSITATMVNPYGWKIYKVVFDYAFVGEELNYIAEMTPIPFREWEDFMLLFIVLAAWGILAWRRHFPVFESSMLLMGLIASFRSQRDVWLVAIVSCVILASQIRMNGEQQKNFSLLSMLTIIFLSALLIFIGSKVMNFNEKRLEAKLEQTMPVSAVEMVKTIGFQGPLYNNFDWGGYLIWALREPVSMDGRTNLHGSQRIKRSIATWNGGPYWASDPELAAANLVIAPRNAALTQLLRQDRGFNLVYEDSLAAVFVRCR
ncbi:MAG: hypothetical protein QUT30_21340 [Acidobacteriota bacterium]|nr:hypothetical protein [Acidobacteriota bacterium]